MKAKKAAAAVAPKSDETDRKPIAASRVEDVATLHREFMRRYPVVRDRLSK